MSSDTSNVLRLVDSALSERALVFGSLPPRGRDVDLLVRPADVDALIARLAAEGFERSGRMLVRFRGCSVAAVDLVRADAWGLPPAELAELFSAGAVLEGTERIVTPAPHHQLLILARRLSGRHLTQKHRESVEAALAREPRAWQIARDRAGAWRLQTELAHLQARYLSEERTGGDRRWRRPARTRIIALSGLDGSGKSSQTQALAAALRQLGYEPAVEWAPSHGLQLSFVANPVRRMLRLGNRSTAPGNINPDLRPAEHPPAVAHVWLTVQALATAAGLWRGLGPHIGRGRVVVFDRYALDYAVFMRYRHGAGRRFRFQTWLSRALSPRPYRAYVLDVPAETAIGRKRDQYDVDELRRQAELYREERAAFGAARIDGERPYEELCEWIAADVWRSLTKR
jgi:thymidylate kinase